MLNRFIAVYIDGKRIIVMYMDGKWINCHVLRWINGLEELGGKCHVPRLPHCHDGLWSHYHVEFVMLLIYGTSVSQIPFYPLSFWLFDQWHFDWLIIGILIDWPLACWLIDALACWLIDWCIVTLIDDGFIQKDTHHAYAWNLFIQRSFCIIFMEWRDYHK